MPAELPDLRRVGIIALDTETNDEGLRADRGSAWPWRGGYVCGISVAWRADGEHSRALFPAAPSRQPELRSRERLRWLKDLFASDVAFVTQNGLYDWGWLRADVGIAMPPSERLEEIGALATLIDENRFNYSLDALCAWRGLPGKDDGIAGGGGQGRRLQDQQEEPATIVHLAIAGASMSAPTPRPMRSPRWRYLRDLEPDPRPRGHPRRLSA